ncbi:MAG: glycosyltransferase family 39 protein, partial [Candidatus Omnitrophota bacterium]
MKVRLLFLIALVLVGGTLRLYGINFGLPYLYHPDEPVAVHQTLRMAAGHWLGGYSFHPHFFNYLLLGLYGAHYLVLRFLGSVQGVEGFTLLFAQDPTMFYLLGRLLSACFSIATVPLLYKVGKRIYGKQEGLVAACFLTFSFLHIVNAHYLKLSMAEAFFVLAAFYFMIGIIQQARRRDYTWAGFFSGAALSINYNAGLVIPFVAFAHLLRVYRQKDARIRKFFSKDLALGLGMALAGFIVTSPLLLFDINSTLRTLQRFSGFFGSSAPAGPGAGFNPMEYYLFSTLRYGLGLPLEVLILGGMLLATASVLKARRAEETCYVLFVLFYLLVFSRLHFAAHRYLMPILPFLLLAGAKLLTEAARRISVQAHPNAWTWGITALLVVLPCWDAIYHDWLINARKDTRTQAKEWIEANVPEGAGVAIENYVRVPAFQPPLLESSEESRLKLSATLWKSSDKGEYRSLLLKIRPSARQY